MYKCLSVYMYMQEPNEVKRISDPLERGLHAVSSLCVCAGNWTVVFCKGNKCSLTAKPSLQPHTPRFLMWILRFKLGPSSLYKSKLLLLLTFPCFFPVLVGLYSQRPTWANLFSPSVLWVLGVQCRCQAWWQHLYLQPWLQEFMQRPWKGLLSL